MIRLAVRCGPEHAERVLAELLALAPDGVEEERGKTYVEYAIYGAAGELPSLPDLEATAGDGTVEVSATEVPDDWGDRWRDFHRPVEVGGRLRVTPSWEGRLGEGDGMVEIVVDPARAFGTGTHPTTRLCLELLVELADAGRATGPLADWGTGSGVLAIAAAKLGFSPVVACDHEPAALQAARRNATVNGVELGLARINLREERPPSAPTVIANLTAPVLTAIAEELASGGDAPPATLVCSGLLGSEVEKVAAAFGTYGLGERDRRAHGDWHALLLARS